MPENFAELPEHLQRLDDMLAQADDEAFLLTELDGFLCAIAVSPSPVARSDYLPFDWAADERGVLKPGLEELEALAEIRLAEIEQELANGAYSPLFEVDDETGDVLWQAWLAGFQQAMHYRFEAWDALLRETEDEDLGEAAMGLASALMLADPDTVPDESAGDEEWAEFDEMHETMPMILAQTAVLLYRLHRQN